MRLGSNLLEEIGVEIDNCELMETDESRDKLKHLKLLLQVELRLASLEVPLEKLFGETLRIM